jgi:hypothetical protein
MTQQVEIALFYKRYKQRAAILEHSVNAALF